MEEKENKKREAETTTKNDQKRGKKMGSIREVATSGPKKEGRTP